LQADSAVDVNNRIALFPDQGHASLQQYTAVNSPELLRGVGEDHPTPPVWLVDSSGSQILNGNGDPIIKYGYDMDVPVPLGMVRSFFDAPGMVMADGNRSVFREELNEITYSVGLEYWYRKQFAIRGGYFHEHETKGNRKYFTAGVGLRLNVFALDFSYLIPVKQNNPLANTLRFTLGFELGKPQLE